MDYSSNSIPDHLYGFADVVVEVRVSAAAIDALWDAGRDRCTASIHV